jgi:RNA polymerase sigma-70 factor (ECF subfamily)
VNETDATNLVTELFDLWYSSLVRYALRSTPTYELAEDLSQEVFMKLYQALRAGKSIEHPKSWTLCVMRREVSRQLQDEPGYEELDERQPAPAWPEDAGVSTAIQDLLRLLSPREEEVVLLRLEPMKYQEIADYLGITLNSVKTLLTRALRKLQKAAAQHAVNGNVNIHETKPVKRAS